MFQLHGKKAKRRRIAVERASLLAHASVQAYNFFHEGLGSVTCPEGFEIVGGWSGVDKLPLSTTVERYGVVFRTRDAPYTYVFAFRGTSSVPDLLEDLGAERVSFTPYGTGTPLPDVEVEQGFYSVYTSATDGVKPMQQQLFEMLDEFQGSHQPIHELLITGHSLGAALSQLFTLDLALNRPEIAAQNFNFASPRVGNRAFARAYEAQKAEKDPERHTIRFQNVYDVVPCVPPRPLGYVHTPRRYLVAFRRESSLDDPVDLEHVTHNHSMTNYAAVIREALESSAGFRVRRKWRLPGNTYELVMEKPDPDVIEGHLHSLKDLLQRFRLWIG